MTESFDVVVVGGGTTGTGVIRDLALRGFENSLLLERDDLAAGTSGACHSALHGGSRYVVSDRETAEECLQENEVYRRIVPQVVDPTDALWVAATDEQVEFAKEWMAAADRIGLPYEVVDVAQAVADEPLLSPDIKFALRTIDTGFDPFRLCVAQAADAVRHGAQVRTHHEVVGVVKDGSRVTGLRVLDRTRGSVYEVRTKLVVNATGPWCSRVTELAGFAIPMKPNKGTTGVYSMRPTSSLIGILRVPADGDGLVSQGYQNTALLGTSSVDVEDPDAAEPGLDEVKVMEDSVAQIIPGIREARFIRMCCGVRPLYSQDEKTGRSLSRGMFLLDHEEMEGVSGIVTITGGKYATARLMAERAVDLVSLKLVGEVRPCVTATSLMDGAESKEQAEADALRIHDLYKIPHYTAHKLTARYGSEARRVVGDDPEGAMVIDDAVQSLAAEVGHALEREGAVDFDDVRRRTRIGMGQDQGAFSIYKAAAYAVSRVGVSSGRALELAKGLLQERWHGVRFAVRYGHQLPASALLQEVYVGTAGYDVFK